MATFDRTEAAMRQRTWVSDFATAVVGGSQLAVGQGSPVQAWAQHLCGAVQALGLTGAVTAPAYVVATFVVMAPATLIKVLLNALGADAGRFGWTGWALLALGLVASVIATWMFARTLRAERVLIKAEGGADAARVRAGSAPLRKAG